MKIICDSAELAKACMNVQRTVSSKSAIAATEGILLCAENGSLTLTGYDLEVGTKTQINAEIEREGSIVLGAKHLCDILRLVPGDTVLLDSDERNICKIVSSTAKYSIIGLDPDDFPEVPSVAGSVEFKIGCETLKDMIRKTIFSVSTSERNPVHCGIKFELDGKRLILVAVDGARLAVRRHEVDYSGEPFGFVVPAKTLGEVVRLGQDDSEYKITVGKRHICFQTGGYVITSRLLEGNFIDYKSAVPRSHLTEVIAEPKNIIDCVERTALIITDKSSPLRCAVENSSIRFYCVTSLGTASDSTEAQITGADIEIGFNNRFITDALKACECETVVIRFNSPNQPITITAPEGDEFLYLILPVRL